MRLLVVALAASLAACTYEPEGFPCALDGTCPEGWVCQPGANVCVDGEGADAGAPPASCEVDNGGCDPNALCSMQGTSIVCECRSGFSGDGLECLPTNCQPDAMPVPAGRFALAATGETVSVNALCLDTREVTVTEYDVCVGFMVCTPLDGEVDCAGLGLAGAECDFQKTLCNSSRPDGANHPVNCIARAEAASFCQRLGKRLPTEKELEWVARGGRAGRTYTWGEEAPSATLLNACGSECRDAASAYGLSRTVLYSQDDGFPETSPPGSFSRDRSPWGHSDLAGNLAEWSSSNAEVGGAQKAVVCGGSFLSGEPQQVQSSARQGVAQGVRGPGIGFRCVRDL